MPTETQNPAPSINVGDLATILSGPGYPTYTTVIVASVDGRTITASMTTASGLHPAETYTLRRNGKYALKGGGQWSNYLRFKVGA